jgi:YVTN family beta-propeller protein
MSQLTSCIVSLMVLPLLCSSALPPAEAGFSVSAASPQAPDSGSKPQTTLIAVGFGPQGIAFTLGAVWVAYGNDREYGVARIDRQTSKVLTKVPTGRWPVGAAAGEDGVWIVNRDDNTVTRVSPENNGVVATIAVGKKPLGIAVAYGYVWVANSGAKSVSRIDPKTNSVTATIEVGKQPSSVAASDDAIWVANFGSHSVSRIDAKSVAVVATIKVGGDPNTIIARGTDVWAVDQYGFVSRIDTRSNSIITKTAAGFGLSGLAIAGNSLWVADGAGSSLLRIDLETNMVTGKIGVGNNPVILGRGTDDEGAIWVSNTSDGTVMKITF